MQEQAKPRKKKKSGCGTVILAVLLVLVAAAAFVAFTLAGEIGGKEGGAQVTVTIEQGSGPATIGRKLADACAEGAKNSRSGDSVLIRRADDAGQAKKMILEEVAAHSRCVVLLKGSHASGLSSLADDLAGRCR